MSQIMKTFLGVFMILLMAVTTAGILGAFLCVLSAQNLHSMIICELEDSDYNSSVMAEGFEKTKAAGDELTVVLYHENNTVTTCHNSADIPADCSDVEMAKVELQFNYNVGFFDINNVHVLSGYAR